MTSKEIWALLAAPNADYTKKQLVVWWSERPTPQMVEKAVFQFERTHKHGLAAPELNVLTCNGGYARAALCSDREGQPGYWEYHMACIEEGRVQSPAQ